MSDDLKSAFELAMEKLQSKDSDGSRPAVLSDDQKSRIAAVRRDMKAKVAELEIAHSSCLTALAESGDAEKLREEEADFRRKRQQLADREEERVAAIRAESAT